MRPECLGIVGLGAVGGSVAWQAARSGVPRVIGFSPVPAEGVAAVRAGAITDLAPSVRFLLERVDFAVLAVPAAAAIALLEAVARYLPKDALCTDTVPAKAAIASVAQRRGLAGRFAGSHPTPPFRGRSFAAAEPEAFRHSLVYVSPVGTDDTTAREVADFWATVCGAEPVIVPAADHDAVVAWTQHLPRVVAAALIRASVTGGPRGVTFGAAARKVADTVPEAGTDLADVLLLHRESVLAALDEYETTLGTLRRALGHGDARRLRAWVAEAAAGRGRIGS